MSGSREAQWNRRNKASKIEPLKYGDFLYPGTRTYSAAKQCMPVIEELTDVMESEDHSILLEELISRLDTDTRNGLREDQVVSIRERYGENIISAPEKNKLLDVKKKIRGTYRLITIGIIFCFTTAAIPRLQPPGSFALDNMFIGLVMVLTVVVSAIISYWQEQKSEKVMSSLKDLYPQHAIVVRDGKRIMTDIENLVVGDLTMFHAGDSIPADLRIIKAWNVEIMEAPLIFKGNPSTKSPECTSRNPSLSENVAFFGTTCTNGYGQGIVIATGNRTAYGQMMKNTAIFQKMNTTAHETIKKIILSFGAITSIICLIMLPLCILQNVSWVTVTVLILVQIIASMPEILYSTITACLSQTVVKMTSHHCLPKNYEAVERLGSVSTICCSKTGILTQNKMTVVALWIDGKVTDILLSEDRTEMKFESTPHNETWKVFFRTASLCSKTFTRIRRMKGLIKEYFPGDQSEIAIMEFLNYTSGNSRSTEKIDNARSLHRKVFEIPYDSYKKYHVTIHDLYDSSSGKHDLFLLCIKGAVDVILNFCSTVLIEGQDVPIPQLKNLSFHKDFEKLMDDGDRIIGFCDYELPKDMFPRGHTFQESDVPLTGLRFLGFVSLMDPPNATAPHAVEKCKRAGIKVVMMTRDHQLTAKAIARQVGIISPESETKHEIARRLNIKPEEVPPGGAQSVVITGQELQQMDVKTLQYHLQHFREIVFARINSRQKLDVVKCLQSEGEIVAFTGNTLEDTSAMRKADIGIGMSMRGCDDSRNAADIILLGDDFSSIVAGIEAGRLFYENLRKAVVYVFSSHIPELSPIFVICLLKIPFTIGAVFILFITLLGEMFPVLQIVQEKATFDIMTQYTLEPSKFFDKRLIQKSYLQTGVVGFLSGMFIYFVIMGEQGFTPSRVLGVSNAWDSSAINDLTDSYNQEWTYTSRKSLEYTCQTGFFVSIIILQLFSIGLFRRWRSPRRKIRLMACKIAPVIQILMILFLMYTPRISTALHFYPIKVTHWILCLPLPVFYLVYEELRKFIISYSKKNSWLERETY